MDKTTIKKLGMFASAESYRKKVIPHNAPPIQVIEMGRSFKAGWISAFRLVVDLAGLEEDEALACMEFLQNEVDEYLGTMTKEAEV